MGAIEMFDQMGSFPDQAEAEKNQDGMATGEGDGSAAPVVMMEQLLEQVEGNPVSLMRNQFMLEEQRLRNSQGGALYEPRPW